MFDPNFDPLETLKNHDNWICEMAQHNEQLAEMVRDTTILQTRQDDLIRQMVRTIQMQYNIIAAMDDRVKRLEELHEIKD
jgi:hypothetical protein